MRDMGVLGVLISRIGRMSTGRKFGAKWVGAPLVRSEGGRLQQFSLWTVMDGPEAHNEKAPLSGRKVGLIS
jgi:hypothetical protein